MRVLFLTSGPEEGASPRYRVHQYLPYLREHGVECVVRPPIPERLRHIRGKYYHLCELIGRWRDIRSARAYSVVFVQKQLTSCDWKGLDRLLFAQDVPVIYDFDDAVYLGNGTMFRSPLGRRLCQPAQVTQIVRQSSLILAGNSHLAKWARQHNQTVEVMPTVVDLRTYPAVRAPTPRVPTLVWIGSQSTNSYLNQIAAPLARLALKTEVILRVVSDTLAGIKVEAFGGVRIMFVKWSREREMPSVAECHAGLMPLPNDEWTQGKCGLKLLQYMGCFLPSIASPVGVAGSLIQSGVNGYLAGTEDDWLAHVEASIARGAACPELSRAARRTAEQWSLDVWAPRLLSHLTGVT